MAGWDQFKFREGSADKAVLQCLADAIAVSKQMADTSRTAIEHMVIHGHNGTICGRGVERRRPDEVRQELESTPARS